LNDHSFDILTCSESLGCACTCPWGKKHGIGFMVMKCLRSAMINYISRDCSCLHQTPYKLRSTICLSTSFPFL